jgi:uncharacterized protein (TIGR02246 family)
LPRALNALAEHWQSAWNKHDMDLFAKPFDDDVEFVTKSGTWAVQNANIETPK